jgi:hypothetical protein
MVRIAVESFLHQQPTGLNSRDLRPIHRQLPVRASGSRTVKFEGHLDHRPFTVLGPGSGRHGGITDGPEVPPRVFPQQFICGGPAETIGCMWLHRLFGQIRHLPTKRPAPSTDSSLQWKSGQHYGGVRAVLRHLLRPVFGQPEF